MRIVDRPAQTTYTFILAATVLSTSVGAPSNPIQPVSSFLIFRRNGGLQIGAVGEKNGRRPKMVRLITFYYLPTTVQFAQPKKQNGNYHKTFQDGGGG